MGAEKREIWMDRRKKRKEVKAKAKAQKKHDKKTKFFKEGPQLELPSTDRTKKLSSKDLDKIIKPKSVLKNA